jgi:hypothetical protein
VAASADDARRRGALGGDAFQDLLGDRGVEPADRVVRLGDDDRRAGVAGDADGRLDRDAGQDGDSEGLLEVSREDVVAVRLGQRCRSCSPAPSTGVLTS